MELARGKGLTPGIEETIEAKTICSPSADQQGCISSAKEGMTFL
jgi:hypothetical protein